MILGYNTNGLVHHRLLEALDLLVVEGYRGVALTLDVGSLDPREVKSSHWSWLSEELRQRDLRCVVETGGRFLFDARRKHWPNLCTVEEGHALRRVSFYRKACDIAATLGAPVVSLWSGAVDEGSEDEAFQRLLPRLERVLDGAREAGVRVAFEPEPGMVVGDLAAYRRLRSALGRDDLGTTLDVGHLLVTEEGPAQSHLAEFADSLVNVHLDDCPRGLHEHRPFGQGDLDLAAVLRELNRMGYTGMASVELSRDSHRAAEAVQESMQALRAALAAQR